MTLHHTIDLLGIMSLIAIDKSLRLYMITNFFLYSETLLVVCICKFWGGSRRKKLLMKKTSSHVPIGLLRQQKANLKKNLNSLLKEFPKKTERNREKMDFVRSLSVLRSKAPQAVGRKGVSPCTLVLSPGAFRSIAPHRTFVRYFHRICFAVLFAF